MTGFHCLWPERASVAGLAVLASRSLGVRTEDRRARDVEWVTVWLAVGMVASYLLVGYAVFRHTFTEAEPDRGDRLLLAFGPVLYVLKRLAKRFTKGSEKEPRTRPPL